MVRSRNLSSDKRAQIQALHDQGMSQRQISTVLKVSQSVVCKTMTRITELGSFKSRNRSGRPRVTSPLTERKIRRAAVANPSWSAKTIAIETRTRASIRTVRRRLLVDFNLPSRRPAKKSLLSAKNIRDRIQFCKLHKNWTQEQWKNVLFSDESTFSQYASYVRHVRRPVNQRYNMRYVVPTVKQAPTTMIWGSFGARGRGGIWFLPKNTTINGAVYLDILKAKLDPHMNILTCSVFQHDGAPCHRAKTVKQWLEQQGIEVLGPWPGSSPDLNPIENLWMFMKEQVSLMKPSSEKDLIAAIKQVWTTRITPQYCETLACSMPDRIKAVLAAKGRHTKY